MGEPQFRVWSWSGHPVTEEEFDKLMQTHLAPETRAAQANLNALYLKLERKRELVRAMEATDASVCIGRDITDHSPFYG